MVTATPELAEMETPRAPAWHTSVLTKLGDLVVDNPIFLRELRRRMRGRALFTAMIAYIAIMAAVAFITILVRTIDIATRGGANVIDQMSRMSADLFTFISVIQGVLVLLIGPIITAQIASSEKEKKTLDFLQVTTLSPWSFIFGALASTMLYILLVLLCALPILSITFLFGGVAPSDIISSFGSLLLMSTILSAGALWVASVRERTRSAQSALLFVVGVILAFFALARALMTRMINFGGGGSSLLPFSSLAPGGEINLWGLVIPAWWGDILGSVLVIGFLALLAARRIFNPENRALNYWQGLAFFTLLMLVISAQMWGMASARPEEVPLVTVAVWVVIGLLVLVFNTGRAEMGNEVWRLKRRFAFLRGIDESVIQILALIAIWWIVGQWWMHNTGAWNSSRAMSSSLWRAAFIILAANVLLNAAFARFATMLTTTRGGALRMCLFAFAALYGVLPVLFITMIALSDYPLSHTGMHAYLSCIPWVALVELGGVDMVEGLTATTVQQGASGVIPGLYIGLASILFLGAYLLYRRRWAQSDYAHPRAEERLISEKPYVNPIVFGHHRD